jgi:hypothetical protein
MTTIIHNYAKNSDSSEEETDDSTYVKLSISPDKEPEILIDTNYNKENGPENVFALIKSICSVEGFTELSERFFDKINEKNKKDADTFITYCVEDYVARNKEEEEEEEEELEPEESDRTITWDFVDHEELMKIQMLSIKQQLQDEGEEDITIIEPDADSEEQIIHWIGNTNFDLNTYGKTIEQCVGVDHYIQLSRYRFTFVVGNLFDMKDIRKDLIEQLSLKNTPKTV